MASSCKVATCFIQLEKKLIKKVIKITCIFDQKENYNKKEIKVIFMIPLLLSQRKKVFLTHIHHEPTVCQAPRIQKGIRTCLKEVVTEET